MTISRPLFHAAKISATTCNYTNNVGRVGLKASDTSSWARLSAKRVVAALVSAIALAVALWLVDIHAIGEAARRLSGTTIAIVVLALTAGALLASARLACVAADVGYKMRASDAIAALSLGQLAGALFFQLVGQIIARSAVLSRRGVPIAGTILLTGYERLLALLVSVGFAIVGAWLLFGKISIQMNAGGATFVKLIAGGLAAVAVSAALAWGKPFAEFARNKIGPYALVRLTRSLLLSFGIQVCTMGAYVAAVLGLSPGMDITHVAAAAAVVMLAAAVPVSLAGWGVRELGAIYALGFIGVDRETAVVVSILIGAAALAVVGGLATATALFRPNVRQPVTIPPAPAFDTGTALAWGIPVLTAIAVFFQVHVPLATSRLNVNLADPLAIAGAAILVAGLVSARHWPSWRLPHFNIALGLMTACITLGFLHGWMDFGLTSWALTNRFAGWFILLAYLATGSLIVSRGGEKGFEMLLLGFAAAAIGVIIVDLTVFCMVRIGLSIPREIIKYRSEGFAQNANAFALQIMFAIAAVIAAVRAPRAQALWLSALFIGLWFSGSRSGLIALAVVVPAAMLLHASRPAVIASACAATVAAVVVVDWLPEIIQTAYAAIRWLITAVQYLLQSLFATDGGGMGDGMPSRLALTPPRFSPMEIVASGYQPSNVQRIASLKGGLAMFLENPIFGAGLGAFTAEYLRAHGVPLVIHSTPLWLLAEFGVIGFLIFAAPFVLLLKQEIARTEASASRTFTILMLLGFAAIAAVHDMVYQRAFWLLMGAALAAGAAVSSHPEPRRTI